MSGYYANGRKVTLRYDNGEEVSYTELDDEEAKGMAGFLGSLGLGIAFGSYILYSSTAEEITNSGAAELLGWPVIVVMGIFAVVTLIFQLPFRYFAAKVWMAVAIYLLLAYLEDTSLNNFNEALWLGAGCGVATYAAFAMLWPYPGKFALMTLASGTTVYVFFMALLAVTPKELNPDILFYPLVGSGCLGGLLFLAAIVVRGIPAGIMEDRMRFNTQSRY